MVLTIFAPGKTAASAAVAAAGFAAVVISVPFETAELDWARMWRGGAASPPVSIPWPGGPAGGGFSGTSFSGEDPGQSAARRPPIAIEERRWAFLEVKEKKTERIMAFDSLLFFPGKERTEKS